MIDHFSLQALVDISQHGALSKVLTHLIIGLDDLRAIDQSSPDLMTLDGFGRWRSADCAQQALLYGGGAVDLLTNALVNLPNLKSIDIRDFNSKTRYRDAVAGKVPDWRSYGSSHYQQWPRETRWLLGYSSETKFVETIFSVILTALGRCSKTVESLEVILRSQRLALGDDALAVLAVPDNAVAMAVSGLTKLHLDLKERSARLSSLPLVQLASVQSTTPHLDFFDPGTMHIRRLLGLARNVMWLRLNFCPNAHSISTSNSPSKLLAWLGLQPDFSPPLETPWGKVNPAPITPPLRRLDLGRTTTTAAVLRRILTKFANLECISIRDFRLQGQGGTSSPHQYATDGNGDCLWARLIRNLHVTNPKLKQIELLRISEDVLGRHDRIVWRNETTHTKCEDFTRTRVAETTSLERLAENTWTEARWYKEKRIAEGIDGDSVDEEVDEEEASDIGEEEEELSEEDE